MASSFNYVSISTNLMGFLQPKICLNNTCFNIVTSIQFINVMSTCYLSIVGFLSLRPIVNLCLN